MVHANTVCIKALRSRGGLIEWNYDKPQQASKFWLDMVSTMRTPDTGESLFSAAYFRHGDTEPYRYHERLEIKVGDKVTWRSGRNRIGKGMPIGIANCTVVDLGETAAGQPAAYLKLPKLVEGSPIVDGLDLSQPVATLVCDLEL